MKRSGSLVAKAALAALLAASCHTRGVPSPEPDDIGARDDLIVDEKTVVVKESIADFASPGGASRDLGLTPTGVDELWVIPISPSGASGSRRGRRSSRRSAA